VPSQGAKGGGATKTILVAEDDGAARALVKDALSEVPQSVVTAVEDGAMLLEMLSTVHPDLIVLDVNMPGLSGIDVYRLIREREGISTVPVLFVTAEEHARAKELQGPFRWLTKPYDVNDLVRTAAELLDVDPSELVD
jgi:two-component system phosphate regulon response regulator PhoB